MGYLSFGVSFDEKEGLLGDRFNFCRIRNLSLFFKLNNVLQGKIETNARFIWI